MISSWHSYPKIYALGHHLVRDLTKNPVIVEEKIDGSQFSFGVFDGTLKTRSKSVEWPWNAPEKMFQKAVDGVRAIQRELHPGWTYRAEYLQKPKHNTLTYGRVPRNHVVVFDINTGEETYLNYEDKATECMRLGIPVVPKLAEGFVTLEDLQRLMDTTSFLGHTKIEGVVLKPQYYDVWGPDKKVLMGKHVSEAFKEVHQKSWKAANPGKHDIVRMIVEALATEARREKAVQHLRERGELVGDPTDIGKVIKEVVHDTMTEERDMILDHLWRWAHKHIERGVARGVPEWYKEKLLEQQFATDDEAETAGQRILGKWGGVFSRLAGGE